MCAWFSHKAQIFCLVQGQCLVDMASRVDKGSLRSLLGHREYVLLVPQLLSTSPTLIYGNNVTVLRKVHIYCQCSLPTFQLQESKPSSYLQTSTLHCSRKLSSILSLCMTESAARILPFKESPRGSLAAIHLAMINVQIAKVCTVLP